MIVRSNLRFCNFGLELSDRPFSEILFSRLVFSAGGNADLHMDISPATLKATATLSGCVIGLRTQDVFARC